MTVRECLDKTRKLINYYSISGETITASDPKQADYSFRALSAIDTAQKELAARRPLIRHTVLTQHEIRPLAVLPGMRKAEGDVVLEAAGAGAFSMMCDADCTVVMERWEGSAWQTAAHLGHTGCGMMETVCLQAQTLPPQDDRVRVTVSGGNMFIADAALYRKFPENEDIPLFGTRRFHALPEDFRRMVECRPSGSIGKVMRSGFSAVQDGKIGFPWDFDGTAAIEYTLWPKTVDESTGIDQELELGADAAEIVPFYAAAMLLTDEDPALAEFFLSQYTQRLRALEMLSGFGIRNTLFSGGGR